LCTKSRKRAVNDQGGVKLCFGGMGILPMSALRDVRHGRDACATRPHCPHASAARAPASALGTQPHCQRGTACHGEFGVVAFRQRTHAWFDVKGGSRPCP
jgi:hypothetical protein